MFVTRSIANQTVPVSLCVPPAATNAAREARMEGFAGYLHQHQPFVTDPLTQFTLFSTERDKVRPSRSHIRHT